MTFSIHTLGCKVNTYETDALIEFLEKKGFLYQKENKNVDISIVNTCTVTQTSDQKSRQMLSKAKKNNPSAIIIAMGCFAQTHPSQAGQLADIVVGTQNRLQIYELINDYIRTKQEIEKIIKVPDIMQINNYEDLKLSHLTTRTRGFIKIEDGCENFCSYCLIPYARGKVKSRPVKSILHEINSLVETGVKEVILSGINTGAYGKDLQDMSLALLLKEILSKTAIFQIRISSIELTEITDELLEVINENQDRIAHHFHIPMQGGVDSVLKRMNRHYLTEDFNVKVDKIRSLISDVAITTDCLAGFVGETESEFEDLKKFIMRNKFQDMHIFPFSSRPNTLAHEMKGHLDQNIIKERAFELIKIKNQLKENFIQNQIGNIYSLIIEQYKDGYSIGHTSNYLEVYVHAKLLVNEVVNVKLEKFIQGKLIATLERRL